MATHLYGRWADDTTPPRDHVDEVWDAIRAERDHVVRAVIAWVLVLAASALAARVVLVPNVRLDGALLVPVLVLAAASLLLLHLDGCRRRAPRTPVVGTEAGHDGARREPTRDQLAATFLTVPGDETSAR